MKKMLSLILLFAFLTATAHAAQRPPTSVDVLDRQRQERPAPQAQPKPVLEEKKEQDSSKDTSQEFVLKGIEIEGNTVFTDQELIAPHAALLGQSITFNRMLSIVEDMTRMYREAGHILSRVILPPQDADLQGAVVRLQAIEGYVAGIEYKGDAKFVEQFKSYFSGTASKVLAMKPLNHNKFESLMLLMQDVPGLEIATSFQPANEATGASTLVVDVGRKIISGNVGVNNTGSESSGPIMFNAGLTASSFPIIGLQANLAYGQASTFDEYHYWQAGLSYRLPIGLTFSGNYGQSYSPKPDTEFARLFDYETSSKYYSFGLSYPIMRSRDMNLNASLFYNHRDSTSMLSDSIHTEDKTRNMTLSLAFDASDTWGGVNQVILDYSHGLDVAGASNEEVGSSRPSAAPGFNKFSLFVSRNQQLFDNFSLYVSGMGQTADKPLFSYDQFSLGGTQFGRGYDSGMLSGDQGVAAAAELRYTYMINDYLGVQPFAFVDWGTTRFLPVEDLEPEWLDLSSYGVGVNFWGTPEKLPDFNASIFVAKPMQTVLNAKPEDWRVVFQVSFMF